MMNLKLLEVVTPTSIYNGSSTQKPFWDKIFIGEENFTLGEFTATNMKCFGIQNVRKHREIKDSD